jgi:hypothetical protein
MPDKEQALLQQDDLAETARKDPKQVAKIMRRQFFQLREEERRLRFIELNRPNVLELRHNETLPLGTMILFNGCLFASLYMMYTRSNVPLFSWGRYARSQYKKTDSTYDYGSSTSRQRFTYERVYGQHSQQNNPMFRNLPSGDMQQWEVDLVRRHMQTLGMPTSQLECQRNVKALCAKEIKKAYLQTSLRTHPDVLSRDASEFERKINLKKFQAASVAYEELKHVLKRNLPTTT